MEKSRKKEILGARKTFLQRVRHFFSRNQKYEQNWGEGVRRGKEG